MAFTTRGGVPRHGLAAEYTLTLPQAPQAAETAPAVQDARHAIAVRRHAVAVQDARTAARQARQRARARAARRAAQAAAAQTPAPVVVPAAPVPAGSSILTPAQIGALWIAEGGNPAAEQTAVCIAEAESGGNVNAVSPTSDDGLYQEHLRPDVLGNAALSTQVAIQMSSNGQSWGAWTTSGGC